MVGILRRVLSMDFLAVPWYCTCMYSGAGTGQACAKLNSTRPEKTLLSCAQHPSTEDTVYLPSYNSVIIVSPLACTRYDHLNTASGFTYFQHSYRYTMVHVVLRVLLLVRTPVPRWLGIAIHVCTRVECAHVLYGTCIAIRTRATTECDAGCRPAAEDIATVAECLTSMAWVGDVGCACCGRWPSAALRAAACLRFPRDADLFFSKAVFPLPGVTHPRAQPPPAATPRVLARVRAPRLVRLPPAPGAPIHWRPAGYEDVPRFPRQGIRSLHHPPAVNSAAHRAAVGGLQHIGRDC